MNVEQNAALILRTSVAILILPIALVYVNRFLIKFFDNRGMYALAPFSWLPIIAGALFCGAALDGMNVTNWLDPGGIWLSTYWELRIDELYDVWLNPYDILLAVIAGLLELRIEYLSSGWRTILLEVIFFTVFVVSGLAWRSLQAARGVLLFFWLTLSSMILMYMAVVTLAWAIHWLNFWLLLVILIYLYSKEGDLLHHHHSQDAGA